ncbi:MAG: hypothetical protein IT332_02900 [Ardenticatenales bacterium]|nr:hypothetical protein [Ardenticatenales bacterium]
MAEGQSNAMRELFATDATMIVWWSTRVEVASAATRREHAGALTTSASNTMLRTLEDLAATWLEVQPVAAIRPLARRLLRTHPLRAADALQLAAAIAVTDGQPETVPFVCLDERLREAARREGLVVIE